ncbi:mechanosensitive ion channel family protein [Planifilum fimeticola]|jgi:small-conductance mechanosensitive channel
MNPKMPAINESSNTANLSGFSWVEGAEKKMWSIINNPVDALLLPIARIILILFLTYVALRFTGKLIDRIFQLKRIDRKKALTLSKLIKSFARYAIYFVAALTLLFNIGIDPTPVLASAGILGLAIGFGAQNLVRDLISGFFIIFEDQMEVGDYVQINGKISGTVEEIGIRVTKIREWNQRLHYLSNGEIHHVANYNRVQMRPLVSVTVPYESDAERVERILNEVCEEIGRRYAPHLVEKPSIYGVTDLGESGVQYTLMALSHPDQYWLIERELRRAVVIAFQKHAIEIAYPRRVLQPPNNGNSEGNEKTPG